MQKDQELQAKFTQIMKAKALRVTKTRRQIVGVLQAANKPLTMQELIKSISEGHYVSVYRSVEALLQIGAIKRIPQGFRSVYELGDQLKPHHHHITCENCGSSVEVNDPGIEELMRKLTIGANMQPTHHHFEAFGLCSLCS